MCPNANSASSYKLQYFVENYVNRNPILYIAITESWLKPYIQDAQIEIKGFNIIRADRQNRERGGSLLYINSNLPFFNEQTYDNDMCEVALCTIPNIKMIVCCFYRPPDATEESFRLAIRFVETYITRTADYESYEIQILGDFNLPNIQWPDSLIPEENFQCSSNDKSTNNSEQILLNMTNMFFLSQYILNPTRKDNILDLFFTNNNDAVLHAEIKDTKISDHRIVEIINRQTLLTFDSPHKIRTKSLVNFSHLNYNKANYEELISHLNSIDWNELNALCNLNEFAELFRLTILQLCQIYVPEKSTKKNNTHAITRKLILRRKKVVSRIRKFNSTCAGNLKCQKLQKEADKLFLEIKNSILNDKKETELKAIDNIKINPRFFYTYANKQRRTKCDVGPLLDLDKKLQNDPKMIANMLQDQYCSAFSRTSSIKHNPTNYVGINPTLKDISFSREDIETAINEMNVYAKCADHDIPAVLIKKCKSEISLPLYLIWSRSVLEGFVPDMLKSQTIIPIYKKGSRALAENYRPISLTSHVIKIFERIVRKKLTDFLESNQLLCTSQHGFRKGRSCLTQLIAHVDFILSNLLDGNDTDVIYLDFQKAFDKVDHNILLQKLRKFGIQGKFHSWISNYLTQRKQVVNINGHLSYEGSVLSGVPQGSVIGPILFLIYINDLGVCIKDSLTSHFADDTRIKRQISNSSDTYLLQSDLNNAIKWSEDNNMMLHDDKFELLCHTHKTTKEFEMLPHQNEFFSYETKECDIYPKKCVKDLGIIITEDLTWSKHIESIANKARKMAAWSLSVFGDRSQRTMLCLFKSFVRSNLEYCCPLWNPWKITDINTLESVQRSFTKRILGCTDLNYFLRLKKLRLLSLQRRRERYIIIYMYKLLNGLVPNDMCVQFYDTQRRGIRARIPSLKPKATSKVQSRYDASFAVVGPKLWNVIPSRLTSVIGLGKFKTSLEAFISNIPDEPPIFGYQTRNKNSILEYHNEVHG